MTQEEKQLLLKDLCARLPYGVIVQVKDWATLDTELRTGHIQLLQDNEIELKPYLRPMSSMTDEEFGFLQEHLPYDFTRIYSGKFNLIDDIHLGDSISIDDMAFLIDYLNKRHFDYRGLIEKGLAIEAPEGMYKF